MHLRRPSGTAAEPLGGLPGHMMLFALLATLVAGCGPSGASPGPAASRTTPAAKLTACGTASTAAGVTVHVEIAQGHVPCDVALGIEHRYVTAIRSGRVRGNGGGEPVNIAGWICQGFTTPVVDQTGDTSKCMRGGTEILEILLPQ